MSCGGPIPHNNTKPDAFKEKKKGECKFVADGHLASLSACKLNE